MGSFRGLFQSTIFDPAQLLHPVEILPTILLNYKLVSTNMKSFITLTLKSTFINKAFVYFALPPTIDCWPNDFISLCTVSLRDLFCFAREPKTMWITATVNKPKDGKYITLNKVEWDSWSWRIEEHSYTPIPYRACRVLNLAFPRAKTLYIYLEYK